MSLCAVTLLGACTPETGPCDPLMARQVVFYRADRDINPGATEDGLPMYEGQALMQLSCGNAQYCHTAGVTGDNRFGVPVGLDFNVMVECTSGDCPPAEGDRLRESQATIFRYRHEILRAIDRGTMPPSGLATRTQEGAGEFLRIDTTNPSYPGGVEEGEPLPPIGSADGFEIMKNWIACGAPVVDRYELPPEDEPTLAGTECTATEDCVYRVPGAEPPDPNWPSIYERVILPRCGSTCHNSQDEEFEREFMNSQLDLSDIDTAYASLVGVRAQGISCGSGPDGVDNPSFLVDPGSPSTSLLIEKIEAGEDLSCGDPMPGAGGLFEVEIEPIRDWISAGALRTP